MNAITLVCMIGIPASGKSSLSQRIKRLLQNEKCQITVDIICFDDFDGFNSAESDWKFKRKKIFEFASNLVDEWRKNCDSVRSKVIVLDDNMYYRSMRYEFVKLARAKQLGYCQIYVEADLSSALYYNKQRSDAIDENIIVNMHKRIELPSPEKYSWEANSLTLSFDDFSKQTDSIKHVIMFSLDKPLKPQVNDERNMLPQSDLHIADLALRRIISGKIALLKSTSEHANFVKGSFALTSEKRVVLAALKSGDILLPEIKDESKTSEERVEIFYQFFSELLL